MDSVFAQLSINISSAPESWHQAGSFDNFSRNSQEFRISGVWISRLLSVKFHGPHVEALRFRAGELVAGLLGGGGRWQQQRRHQRRAATSWLSPTHKQTTHQASNKVGETQQNPTSNHQETALLSSENHLIVNQEG